MLGPQLRRPLASANVTVVELGQHEPAGPPLNGHSVAFRQQVPDLNLEVWKGRDHPTFEQLPEGRQVRLAEMSFEEVHRDGPTRLSTGLVVPLGVRMVHISVARASVRVVLVGHSGLLELRVDHFRVLG